MSGLISSLGDSIRWEIRSVDGGYAIRSSTDTTKYLGVSERSNTSTSEVAAIEIVTVTDTIIPQRCVWSIRIANGGGCLIKNTYNSRYLYSYGTNVNTVQGTGVVGSTYNTRVWRIASISYYGNTSSNSHRELLSGFTISQMIVDIGETKTPLINKYPANAIWARADDFVYTYSSGTSGSVVFDPQKGEATGEGIGISKFTATHKVTGRTCVFWIYVDRYTYELNSFFGFDSEASLLIRDFYNRIDEHYSSYTEQYKAWVASRVLSEFWYDEFTTYFLIFEINKWDDVAGSVTSPSDRETYFIDTLGYTDAEYDKISEVLVSQHSDTQTSDFAHMQFSLAARLAYKLSLDGVISNIYTVSGNENVSYLAGWLGDATLLTDGTTVFGNDDYMADLDAENLFREIAEGYDSITAINTYYETLAAGDNRAIIFKTYLNYSIVENLVLSELDKTLNQIKVLYPDTYDFLMSLKDNLDEIDHY